MKRILIATAIVSVIFGISKDAFAQWDTNGPNAVLTLQTEVPSVTDPVNHNVSVRVPGTFDFRVETNANGGMPVLMIYSSLDPTGANFPTPWGGSIDIGSPGVSLPKNVMVIGDGITPVTPLDFFFFSNQGDPTTGQGPFFQINLAVGTQLDGTRGAFQCIVADPTMAPYFYDNTEAVDANYFAGQTQNLISTSVTFPKVSFLPGKTFNFHGVAYSDVFVSNNGYLTFGAPTTILNGGFNIEAFGLVNAEPMISVFNADWENATANAGIYYEETGNTARIAWGDPIQNPGGTSHYYGTDINRFQVTLQLQDANLSNPLDGEFGIDWLAIDPAATTQNGDGIIGHSPGGAAILGGSVDIDLHVPQIGNPGFAMVEEHNATGGNVSTLGYNPFLVPNSPTRLYNSIHSWNGLSLDFKPNLFALLPGDLGYNSTPSGPAPSDVQSTDPVGWDIAGGQLITIVGKFAGFNDAAGAGGVVTLDPGGAALNCGVIGILDGTGTLQPSLANSPAASPYRNGEGLVVLAPPIAAAGTYDLKVDFFDGSSFTIPITAVNGNVQVSNYTMNNGQTTTHTLNGTTIDFFGNTYTDLHIHAYGYITFGSVGASDYSETMPEFFSGWQASPTTTPRPGVAVNWSDVNRNNTADFEVQEDLTANTVKVSFKNQNHWLTFSAAGTSTVEFGSAGSGSLTFDHSGFLADPLANNTHGVIFGVTDGDDQVGTDVDFSNTLGTGISSVVGTYISVGAGESLGEYYPPGVQPALTTWTLQDVGGGTPGTAGSWFIY